MVVVYGGDGERNHEGWKDLHISFGPQAWRIRVRFLRGHAYHLSDIFSFFVKLFATYVVSSPIYADRSRSTFSQKNAIIHGLSHRACINLASIASFVHTLWSVFETSRHSGDSTNREIRSEKDEDLVGGRREISEF